jgi:hypothetical protein
MRNMGLPVDFGKDQKVVVWNRVDEWINELDATTTSHGLPSHLMGYTTQ